MNQETKTYSTKELFGRFYPYYRPYWKIVIFDLMCAALTTLAELVLPMIIRYLTNLGLNDLESLTLTVVLRLGILYAVLRLIDCVAAYYMAYQGHVMGTYIETDMRKDAYNHLQKLSFTYYNNTKIGQIMGRITNDLFDVTEFAHHCPEEFFIAGIKAVVSFIILARISLPLTVLVFLIVPLMTYVSILQNRRMRNAFARQRFQTGELNARIEDSLLGQKVVKAFTNEDLEIDKFNKENETFFQMKRNTYRYMAAFQITVRGFEGVMYLVLLVCGGLFLLHDKIDPGDLVPT